MRLPHVFAVALLGGISAAVLIDVSGFGFAAVNSRSDKTRLPAPAVDGKGSPAALKEGCDGQPPGSIRYHNGALQLCRE